MFDLMEVIAVMFAGGVMVMVGVFLGGWIAYKLKNAVPGERFFGGVPKGEVFTMKDEMDELMEGGTTAAEKSVLDRTAQFIKALGG